MEEKKRLYLILGSLIAAVVIVAGIVLAVVFALPDPPKDDSNKDETNQEEDIEHDEPMTISVIDNSTIEEGTKERMIAVVIENHTDSRKQMSGLEEASLVFETEAEGGITRFLAFYPYQTTERVGPVRSARPYFVRWAEQFNSAIAHAGGSDLGLSSIYSSGNVFDLDGLALEGGLKYFKRDYVYFAPHNLFTNLKELRELMDERGWDKPLSATDHLFLFGPVEANSSPSMDDEKASTLHIYYPFPQYFVRYEYSEETGLYKRFQAEMPHIDSGNGKQITASNVVVMITDYYSTDSEGRLYMKTEGTGDMYLFRDGMVFPGTWERQSSTDNYKFYSNEGNELVFAPGKTWISVINNRESLQF